jgi:hypothetical protein
MQESPGSDRETIETHSPLSQTSVKPLKSHTQHIQKIAYEESKHSPTDKHIHRENNTNHEIESKSLSINPICT